VAAAVILFALALAPAPLLPPHRFAEAVQSLFGISWKTAYLVTAIGLQAVFFGSIGILSAFVVKRASTLRGRLIQIIVVPLVIVFIGLIIRSAKMGHFTAWINVAIPIAACLLGVWFGLGLLYQRGKIILFALVAMIGATFWLLSGGAPAALSRATGNHLKELVASGSAIPPGEARFGALLKVAFTPLSEESIEVSAIQQNRAAILALGIALGEERLAKFVGLNRDSTLLYQAAQLREGTTLRERADWPRHFCVSAALAILENPLVSDAGGLMKEQLDALTRGSGFSFCDIVADRAGVRFANAATNSEEDAKAMQDLLKREFMVSNVFPPVAGLSENLTVEQFRSEYGAIGSKLYLQKIVEIESRLDNCAALSPLGYRHK
jgi:hypothetical protein